jgi:hypothetical protein
MRTRFIALLLPLALLSPLALFAGAHFENLAARETTPPRSSGIPEPADVLGFNPGDDRKLASWSQVVTYFEALAKASDRVKFETLGQSTLGKPFVMATISAPENLARLEDYQKIQAQLADPRQLGAAATRERKAAELIKRGKTIVLITCGIHSTEVGSYLSSMLIAHRLAAASDPGIQKILRDTIILLVPSLNPDGVDIVKNWYDQTLGTPYEGTDPPQLYNKYVGHDNNRDWYAFTQVETQIAVDRIHNVWHPQIVHDIHQQGEYGARFFLPPYLPPVEPNVPQQIVAGYTELGNFMAREMRDAGFQGITTDSTYDAWSPSRAYSHYHGGVRLLSETASCKLATPIKVEFEQLGKGDEGHEGYDPKLAAANFGPVWRGGEWHLRDITNYMTTAAFLLLRHAAENRERWLSRFYEIGTEAVRPRAKSEPFGFKINVATNTRHLLAVLERGQVEISWLKGERPVAAQIDAQLGGLAVFPGRTAVVPLAQPYGRFAKALLEVQHYPDLRDAQGHPRSPYDVTAHTLSLLMNVGVEPMAAPPRHGLLRRGKFTVQIPDCALTGSKTVAVYRSNLPVMDEGWTRWILGECVEYETITDQEIQNRRWQQKDRGSQDLAEKAYRTIIIPDQPPKDILNGHQPGTMPKEFTGGLGQAGVQALREFVEQGGTLVCLNRASNFAIEQFKLPVRNIVADLSERKFFVPGSILRIELDTSSPLARGMPKETVAWVEGSPVFEVVESAGVLPATTAQSQTSSKLSAQAVSSVRVIARYPNAGSPLLSGWLLGANRIKGKAALVEVRLGRGHMVLFGFRPQYRGQSLATYPLFFNAISGQ